MFRKMVVMDFENQEIIFCQLPANIEPEKFISDMDISPENCQWIIESKKFPIKIKW